MKIYHGCMAIMVFAQLSSFAFAQDKVVCYLGTWAVYRPGSGRFDVDNIDPRLCTHLIYAFVGINTDGDVTLLDAWNDLPEGKDAFRRFNALKAKNPRVKTMVAIGGSGEGSTKYSQVMANPVTRGRFINNVVAFVTKYNFDGFDVDWEYPTDRGGAPEDKANFVSLLRELRARFDERGLLLSAAVAAGRSKIDAAYDVPSLSRYLDFINVMTYDLHGSWETVTGHNAPLYASSNDTTEEARQLNVFASIKYWLLKGAQANKLVMGIGTYGRTFTLSSGNKGLGAPTSGPGQAGPYTRQEGVLGYNEICEQQMGGLWPPTWDDQQKVPYAVNGRTWVGYDNVQSVRLKVEFAKSLGLGGVMIWSLETDDFRGLCHGRKYPLLSAIYEALNGGSPPPPTSGSSGASTTIRITTVVSAMLVMALAACGGAGYLHGGFGGQEGQGGQGGHGGRGGHQQHVVEHYADAHPQYKLDDADHDTHTGDVKNQWETRDGDVVKGSYSLLEADGTTRTVDYTADKHNGFNAVVKRTGHAHHPQQYGGHGQY